VNWQGRGLKATKWQQDFGKKRGRSGEFKGAIVVETRGVFPQRRANRTLDYYMGLMSTILSVPDPRLALLLNWLAPLQGKYQLNLASIAPASNDASFRRYFRVFAEGGSFIVMDAPPPQEDVGPFVSICTLFAKSGASLPTVFEADQAQGFLLLADFGGTTYLDVLAAETSQVLYAEAFDALIKIQVLSQPGVLPPYDDVLLRRELEIFPEWYLGHHKKVRLEPVERDKLNDLFNRLIQNNLAQAKVFVHRDFHSRNLMLLSGAANPGILDFQDAVYGPITYDLVSLLRDAYIAWDEQVVIDGCARYWERARHAGLPVPSDFSEFYRDFEWMGLQRHLKVLGIFARLNYRDGKARYLQDIPLVLDYVIKTASRYNDFRALLRLLERVDPQALTTGLTF
jgi:N-acetylmuramate 1-kinase